MTSEREKRHSTNHERVRAGLGLSTDPSAMANEVGDLVGVALRRFAQTVEISLLQSLSAFADRPMDEVNL